MLVIFCYNIYVQLYYETDQTGNILKKTFPQNHMCCVRFFKKMFKMFTIINVVAMSKNKVNNWSEIDLSKM